MFCGLKTWLNYGFCFVGSRPWPVLMPPSCTHVWAFVIVSPVQLLNCYLWCRLLCWWTGAHLCCFPCYTTLFFSLVIVWFLCCVNVSYNYVTISRDILQSIRFTVVVVSTVISENQKTCPTIPKQIGCFLQTTNELMIDMILSSTSPSSAGVSIQNLLSCFCKWVKLDHNLTS